MAQSDAPTCNSKPNAWAIAGAVDTLQDRPLKGPLSLFQKWETQVAKDQSKNKEVVVGHIRIAIVTDVAQQELQTHLQLNARQLATYPEVRKIVVDMS